MLSRIGKDQVIRAKLDNFHCAAVIHACGVNRQWWKALTVLDMCKKDPNLKLNAFVYGAAMTACMHGKRFDKAMNLFEDFLATRIKSDISIYNIALSAAGKGGHHDKVIAIFSQLLREGAVRPDAITYMAVLNSCAISGDYVKALDIFDQIKDIPWLRPNLKMRTALVTACLKAGRPIEALKIVREVCQDSSISVRSANAEASGDISSEFLHWKFPGTRHSGANKMGIGEAPDSLLIGLGIVACSMLPALSGLAVQLLEQIISNKMEPTYSSISNVIMCLEADGKVEEAIRVYRMCHEMGFLKHQATDVDLPCPLGMESTENISNERIVLNLVGLYGEHMVTTRLRCFFRFVLHKYASRDAKSTSGPGALMIIGTQYCCSITDVSLSLRLSKCRKRYVKSPDRKQIF